MKSTNKLESVIKRGHVATTHLQDASTSEMQAAVRAKAKDDGWTLEDAQALLAAARDGQVGPIMQLLAGTDEQSSALVNTRGGKSRTALMLASNGGHAEIARVLMRCGADPDAVVGPGLTALMLAAKKGHAMVLAALLSHGADPNLQETSNMSTALMLAAESGSTHAVTTLLAAPEASGRLDVNLRNNNGKTALVLACEGGHAEVAGLLLACNGVEVDAWQPAVRKVLSARQKGSEKRAPVMDPFTAMQETLKVMRNGGYYMHPTNSTAADAKVWVPVRQISGARMISSGGTSASKAVCAEGREHGGGLMCTVAATSSFSAADEAVARGAKVMVLDFATDVQPGGGARHGKQQGTQEEMLCRQSTLLSGLETLRYPMPSGGCAVVDGVCVFRNDDYSLRQEPFYVSVVAAAMPNLQGTDEAKKRAVVGQKLGAVLGAWDSSECDTLVLGAWGCGAFGNDAEEMAAMFRDVLQAPRPVRDGRRVVFAVPGGGGAAGKARFEGFQKVFG